MAFQSAGRILGSPNAMPRAAARRSAVFQSAGRILGSPNSGRRRPCLSWPCVSIRRADSWLPKLLSNIPVPGSQVVSLRRADSLLPKHEQQRASDDDIAAVSIRRADSWLPKLLAAALGLAGIELVSIRRADSWLPKQMPQRLGA